MAHKPEHTAIFRMLSLDFSPFLVKGVNGEPYNIGNPKPELSVNELASLMVGSIKTKSTIIVYSITPIAIRPMSQCGVALI